MDTNLAQSRDVFAFVDSTVEKPDVAFFGSSVVEVPFALMDNEEQYVSSPKEAQTTLSSLCKSKKSIAVYAVEAGLISDQLLLLNRLFQLGMVGRHNILAVTPRDFGDSRIPAKNLSDTYRSMALHCDLSLLPMYHDDLDDWTNYILARTIYLYKNKSTLSRSIGDFFSASLLSAMAAFPGAPSATNIVVGSQLVKPTAVASTAIAVEKPTEEQRFLNSVAEYVRVYDYIEKTDSLKTQVVFLRHLVSFCKNNNIELTLVNLPLTAENKALMKPGFYRDFRATLAKVASDNSIQYVDLSANPNFAGREVFYDSAHMGKLGGQRLIEALARQLCQSR